MGSSITPSTTNPAFRSLLQWHCFRSSTPYGGLERFAVRGTSRQEIAMSEKLVTLYGDFGVEMLVLTPEMIDDGYLQTDEFADRLDQAVFSRGNIPPQPPTTARQVTAA